MHSLNAERSRLLKILTDKHPSNLVPIIDYKNLQNMIQKAVKLQAADIDTVVTTDIHRLIRLPNTLHGKTGWQVQTIPYGDLPDYDPLRSAIVLRGPHVKLEFREAPIIKIDETIYGPYSWETAELPLEAAMFYLCKKGARLAR
jgi:DNA primase small subunit